jgi:fatty acid desaturase
LQVLFVSYLSANESLRELLAVGEPLHEATIVTFAFVITYLAWCGLDVNGRACFVLTISVCLPFFVFSVIGFPSVDPTNFFLGPSRSNTDEALPPDASVQWGPLLNCLFWNLNVRQL